MEDVYQGFPNSFPEEVTFKLRPQKLVGDG